ncbi:MAG TPA: hypothetical protein VLX92_15580 [Kofleriaceae bacterium]|nr:hypothetical protein [Kofleriaceae bacterium]
MIRLAWAVVVIAACRSHGEPDVPGDAAAPRPHDARTPDAPPAFPELATFPHVEPVRVVALPARPALPRFDLAGPAIAGDVAIVGSSQFGFVAVDWRRGQIAWAKPTGEHVAPPIVRTGGIVLLADCVNPPDVPAGDALLGCLRLVSPTGADQLYVAIHGRAGALAPFATALGDQRTWQDGTRVIWRRGDQAVAIDVFSGVARPVPATDPPLVVSYKHRSWQIARGEDGVIAGRGTPSWHTRRGYTALIGAVYLPEQAPMIRMSNAGAFAGKPELMLFDMDATGSMNGQVAFPVPGIGLLGHAIDEVGDTALAVRLDTTLERDFVVGYAANALLMWVYPLPRVPRADPVGLAIARDAVLVFHDGDTLTVLPELSAPPTSPGAPSRPSENATP